jgi:hypothetical protein
MRRVRWAVPDEAVFGVVDAHAVGQGDVAGLPAGGWNLQKLRSH